MLSGSQRAAQRTSLGRRGEQYAAGLYRKAGATILATNVRYAVGELDLIVREVDGTIVFVEVKTRSSANYGVAEAVTARKLTRMRKAASQWLRGVEGPSLATVRFDVMALTSTHKGFEVDYYRDVRHGAG